jgi:hypothetical protein
MCLYDPRFCMAYSLIYFRPHSTCCTCYLQVISQRAALVLELLLEGCNAAKQRLLATHLELPSSPVSPPELLMVRIMRLVTEGLRQGKEAGGNLRACFFLRLLIVWLTGNSDWDVDHHEERNVRIVDAGVCTDVRMNDERLYVKLLLILVHGAHNVICIV